VNVARTGAGNTLLLLGFPSSRRGAMSHALEPFLGIPIGISIAMSFGCGGVESNSFSFVRILTEVRLDCRSISKQTNPLGSHLRPQPNRDRLAEALCATTP
jgi:hypothetical protein